MRPFGVMEKYWYMVDRVAPCNGVVTLRVTGPIGVDVLRAGLRAAQRRHPVLNAHVQRTPTGPVWVTEGTGEIPVDVQSTTVAELGDDWSFGEVETEIHSELTAADAPPIRVRYFPGDGEAVITFTVGHVIGDATSLMAFLSDVLRFAGAYAEGREPEVRPLPARPPADQMVPKEYQGTAALRETLRSVPRFVATARRKPRQLRPDDVVPAYQRRTRIIHGNLDEEQSAALLDRCDREGASMHGALCAAALTGIAREVAGSERVTLGVHQSVNLRKNLRPRISGAEIGMYGSGVVTFHDVGGGRDFWSLAREIYDEYEDAILRGDHLVPFPLLRWFDKRFSKDGRDDPDRYVRLLKRSSAAALFAGISRDAPEIGTVGPFEVDVVNAAAGLGWLGTFGLGGPVRGEQLSIGFAYTEPTVSHARARRMVAAAMEVLDVDRLGARAQLVASASP